MQETNVKTDVVWVEHVAIKAFVDREEFVLVHAQKIDK